MPINPNIALSVKGVELQDPLAQYGKVMAIQNAQQQNALVQLQMRQAEREQESTNALNRAYAEAYNPQTGEVDINMLRGSLSTGGYGSKLPGIEKSQLELGKAKIEQQKSQTDLVDAKLKQSRQFLETVDPSDPSSPQQLASWMLAQHNDPVLGPVMKSRGMTADQAIGRLQQAMQQGPHAFAQLLSQVKLGTEKFMEFNKQQLSTADTGGQIVTRSFSPLTGELKTIGTHQKTMAPGEAERIKNEGLRIGLEGRRVAVLEENARREADPAFQQRMGAARVTGEAIAKGDVAAMQALPKVIGNAEMAVALLDQMVGKRDSRTGKLLTKDPVTGEALRNNTPHPGFAPAVGMGGFGTLGIPGIAQITPGTDATDFKTLYDQVMGGAFLEAFETLKGGGAITKEEGTKATAARTRMSLAQSENEFIRSALEYRDIVAKGVERAQAKAVRATDRMVPAGGVDMNNPLLKK